MAQVQVRLGRDFYPAEAGAGDVAAVGHEPLAGKQVNSYATDSADNYVRIYTAPSDCSNYPGQTYSILLTDIR